MEYLEDNAIFEKYNIKKPKRKPRKTKFIVADKLKNVRKLCRYFNNSSSTEDLEFLNKISNEMLGYIKSKIESK